MNVVGWNGSSSRFKSKNHSNSRPWLNCSQDGRSERTTQKAANRLDLGWYSGGTEGRKPAA